MKEVHGMLIDLGFIHQMLIVRRACNEKIAWLHIAQNVYFVG
jgi:hypothetical protein